MTKTVRILIAASIWLLLITEGKSQTSRNIMVGGGLDIIKSDIQTFAGKAQLGFEASYFINRSFGLSGGFEIWSAGNNYFMMGVRWYPVQKFFTRFRGLIGQDTEFGLGAGYSHVLSANWRLEGVADYYLESGELGLRLGAAYIIRK